MRALGGCGDRAGIEFAPDAVAPAGNEPVNRIGKEDGKQAEECGDGGPGFGQLAEGGKDGARAKEDVRLGGKWLTDDEDGAGSSRPVRFLGACGNERCHSGSLEGNETQTVFAIAAEQPPDIGIAETTDAVVDDEEPIAELRG